MSTVRAALSSEAATQVAHALVGDNGLRAVATHPDVDLVLCATTGTTALAAVLAAIESGKTIALANKEVLVMAGALVMEAAHRNGVTILPVDSEHNAIHQCLHGRPDHEVRRLLLTASGGPFRGWAPEQLERVTPADALAHPTWKMGRKITVDSATLMNKAFEVIECRWLFSVPFEQIDVVVHAQSVIHSMVEFADGSVKAQMGPPDMRLPIQYAMAYPDRVPNERLTRYDPLRYPSLTFEELDTARYPAFAMAVAAGRKGQSYPAVLSAADEEAVHLFLDGHIGFGDIHRMVADVLDRHEPTPANTVEAILEADTWARRQVDAAIARR